MSERPYSLAFRLRDANGPWIDVKLEGADPAEIVGLLDHLSNWRPPLLAAGRAASPGEAAALPPEPYQPTQVVCEDCGDVGAVTSQPEPVGSPCPACGSSNTTHHHVDLVFGDLVPKEPIEPTRTEPEPEQ